MNTKEAIEFLEATRYVDSFGDSIQNKKVNEIIALLKRGKKYEEMWGELKVEYTNEWELSHIPISMKELEQKYFQRRQNENNKKE